MEDKRGEQLLSESEDTEPRKGRKCERRAQERLRCRETTLAAHLECRNHQWKMQTSYLNFSSGKIWFTFLI